jgi:hypothetical protein
MFNDPGYTIIMQQKVLKFYRICPFVLRSGRFFPYYQILDLGKKFTFVKHSSLSQRNVDYASENFYNGICPFELHPGRLLPYP